MKSVLSIAPPPPARRHRPLQVEPIVFAVFLMALTLGINIVLPKVETATGDTAHQAAPAQPARVAQVAQVN